MRHVHSFGQPCLPGCRARAACRCTFGLLAVILSGCGDNRQALVEPHVDAGAEAQQPDAVSDPALPESTDLTAELRSDSRARADDNVQLSETWRPDSAVGPDVAPVDDLSVVDDLPAVFDTPRPDAADSVEGGETVWPVPPVPYDGWPALVYGGAILGRSVEDRPIIVERFGQTGPVLLLFHTIHGNERSAEQVGERMRSWLLLHPEATADVQVLFVTQVNPDGYQRGIRYNVNGIDLNRNFPAGNFEPSDEYGPWPASEPETQVIVGLVEDGEPSAIVTVHSPFDVLNYDGPAQALAEWAADVSGFEVEVDLGPYPGSFGSYAGVDLQIPTLTLEMARHVMTLAGHQPGLDVERVALQFVREHGTDEGMNVADLVADPNPADEYETRKIFDSPALRPVVVERFGQSGPPVLVVAGLDGRDQAVFVAERLRALLLSRSTGDAPLGQVFLVAVANPDGVVAGRPLDNAECNPDQSFPAGFVPGPFVGTQPLACAEAAPLAALVQQEGPAAVFVILGDDASFSLGVEGPQAGLRQALLSVVPEPAGEDLSGRPGSLGRFAAESGIPALTVGFGSEPAYNAVIRANQLALGLLAAIDALQNPGLPLHTTCVADFLCAADCGEDPDCSCSCDYNGDVCEAVEPCSATPCACDSDCSGDHWACEADGHCDSWCLRDADPDCQGLPENGMFCPATCECSADACCQSDCPGAPDPDCDAPGCWDPPDCLADAADAECRWDCLFDADCKALSDSDLQDLGFDGGSGAAGRCDYTDGVCEPAYKCTQVGLAPADVFTVAGATVIRACPNDPDCAAAAPFPCAADGYCDSWCPCNLDPDCYAGVSGSDCCPDLSCID